MSEEELYNNIVEILSKGDFLQINGKPINLKELNDYINSQQQEIERLNNIIKHTDSWIDRTMEVIKQQPSEDDTWILERLNAIKKCLRGEDEDVD